MPAIVLRQAEHANLQNLHVQLMSGGILQRELWEEAEEYLRDNEWYTCENYDDEYSEWFDDTFTTPSGEEIIAFGQYGYCG